MAIYHTWSTIKKEYLKVWDTVLYHSEMMKMKNTITCSAYKEYITSQQLDDDCIGGMIYAIDRRLQQQDA